MTADYFDPRWQRLRLEVMNRAGFCCEFCGNAERTLHIHHINYIRGAAIWEYSPDELQCLCDDCHQTLTIRIQIAREALANGSAETLRALADLIEEAWRVPF